MELQMCLSSSMYHYYIDFITKANGVAKQHRRKDIP